MPSAWPTKTFVFGGKKSFLRTLIIGKAIDELICKLKRIDEETMRILSLDSTKLNPK